MFDLAVMCMFSLWAPDDTYFCFLHIERESLSVWKLVNKSLFLLLSNKFIFIQGFQFLFEGFLQV